jgi:hypothetical protein
LIPQPFTDSFWLGSLKVTHDVHWAELESVTAYYHRKGDLIVDDTESVKWGPPEVGWGNPLGPAYPLPGNLVTTYTQLRQDMFSQELRLVSPIRRDALTWNAGISYVNTHDTEAYRVVSDFIPNLRSPLDFPASTTTVPQRLAAYGQVARTFGRFTVRAAFRIEHDWYESDTPPTAGSPALYVPQLAFHGTASATLGIPAFSFFYQPAADSLYYLTASKGFSPAGVDAALPTCFQAAQPYPTDTLWSYELGAKFGLIEEEPYLHVALFDSRWDNGPDLMKNCLVTHIPGSAFSRGVELKAGAPLRDLRAALDVTYIDARYTDTLTDSGGNPLVNDGDALGTPPLVASPWNVLASLEQGFSLRDGLRAALRAENAFHSHNSGPFYTGIPGTYYAPGLGGDPSTNLLNLRATVTWLGDVADHATRLDFSLFVNNALDSQPTLLKRNKGVDVSTLYYATTFRPRTVGLSATWQF